MPNIQKVGKTFDNRSLSLQFAQHKTLLRAKQSYVTKNLKAPKLSDYSMIPVKHFDQFYQNMPTHSVGVQQSDMSYFAKSVNVSRTNSRNVGNRSIHTPNRWTVANASKAL